MENCKMSGKIMEKLGNSEVEDKGQLCIFLDSFYQCVISYFSSDGHNSPELLGAFSTKSVPVVYLNYTKHNVLQAAGAPSEGKT